MSQSQTKPQQLKIAPGQSSVFDLKTPIKRVSIADPEIADANVTSPSQIVINGKTNGKTSLVVWDEQENYRHLQIVVLPEQADYQIKLNVRFLEITKNALDELGTNFLVKNQEIGSESVSGGSFGGKVNAPSDPLTLSETVDIFFRVPTQNISTIIKALQEKNILTVLAKPNLSTINGQEASFHAGGEFPIPIVSGSMGQQTISIQFKEFGVKLKFVPTVLDTDMVNIKVEAKVSNLDFENGIILSGFRIPALVVRRAKTMVELKKDEFLVIGGLLSSETAETVSKIPVLGSIPVLGKLFSSKRYLDKESELVIMLSPETIRSSTLHGLPPLESGTP